MIVGVPRETFPGERRVALVPAAIPNLTKAGLEVVVEAGAGAGAGYPDADFTAKGVKIAADRAEVFRAADIVVQILCYGSNDKTGRADVPLFRRGQVLIGFLRPLGSIETLQEIAKLTEGRYFRAADGAALTQALAAIDRLERDAIRSFQYRRYDEGYPWFALASLVCWLAVVGLEATWWRRTP